MHQQVTNKYMIWNNYPEMILIISYSGTILGAPILGAPKFTDHSMRLSTNSIANPMLGCSLTVA